MESFLGFGRSYRRKLAARRRARAAAAARARAAAAARARAAAERAREEARQRLCKRLKEDSIPKLEQLIVNSKKKLSDLKNQLNNCEKEYSNDCKIDIITRDLNNNQILYANLKTTLSNLTSAYNLEKCEEDNDNSSDGNGKEDSNTKEGSNTKQGNNTKKKTYTITPWYVSLIRVIKYTLSYSRSIYTSILSFVPGKNEKNAIPILILLPFVLLFYLFLGIPAIGFCSFILGPALGFSSFSIPGMIFALFALFFGPAAITALFSGLYQGFFIVFITFILPILSNFRELLNIVSNNYCLYTSLFGLLVVSSSFKFLKTEASLVMLVTYIYLLWKTCLKS